MGDCVRSYVWDMLDMIHESDILGERSGVQWFVNDYLSREKQDHRYRFVSQQLMMDLNHSLRKHRDKGKREV